MEFFPHQTSTGMFALFCLDTWQEEEAAWRTCFPARSELFLSNVVIMRPEGHTGPTSRLLLAPASTNTSKRMADMTVAKEIKKSFRLDPFCPEITFFGEKQDNPLIQGAHGSLLLSSTGC